MGTEREISYTGRVRANDLRFDVAESLYQAHIIPML